MICDHSVAVFHLTSASFSHASVVRHISVKQLSDKKQLKEYHKDSDVCVVDFRQNSLALQTRLQPCIKVKQRIIRSYETNCNRSQCIISDISGVFVSLIEMFDLKIVLHDYVMLGGWSEVSYDAILTLHIAESPKVKVFNDMFSSSF